MRRDATQPTDRRTRLPIFKNKTYASLKPLTCSILICLTIVLFPDSPAPETEQKSSMLISLALLLRCYPATRLAHRGICAKEFSAAFSRKSSFATVVKFFNMMVFALVSHCI